MDAQKFGCFVAERRKELNMTQKDLAAKIQVTDKAVSKWERGLGFPDINTIEVLAEALDVSITELMKSERLNENALMEEPVDNVIQVAKADIEERHKIIIYTFAATTVLLTVLEILLSIEWNGSCHWCMYAAGTDHSYRRNISYYGNGDRCRSDQG